jgi:hypothetical protein
MQTQEIQAQKTIIIMPVFRFKLGNEMVDALLQFSKMHQHDDRETYKESWTLWKRGEDILALFENEIGRLKMLGYGGSAENIEDKIFKSGRYYFRNKSFITAPATKRCKYIPVSKELINDMDQFITRHYENVIMNIREDRQQQQSDFLIKPSELFNNFCTIRHDVIKNEIHRLIYMEDDGALSTIDGIVDVAIVAGGSSSSTHARARIINKIKKTFKNRIFKYKI